MDPLSGDSLSVFSRFKSLTAPTTAPAPKEMPVPIEEAPAQAPEIHLNDLPDALPDVYPVSNTNPIIFINKLVFFLIGLVDVVAPKESNVRNLAILNAFQFIDWIKAQLQPENAINCALVASAIIAAPPLLALTFTMVVYTTLVSTVGGFTLTVFAALSSIGLFPLFLVTLALILLLAIGFGLVYLTFVLISQSFFQALSRLPVREVLTYFAEKIPPSIGRVEVKPVKAAEKVQPPEMPPRPETVSQATETAPPQE